MKKILAIIIVLGLLGGGALFAKTQLMPRANTDKEILNYNDGTTDPAHAPPIETNHEGEIGMDSIAPEFKLPNAEGEIKSLSEFLETGPVILSFYRGGWCPFCNDQLYAYQQILPEFEELGAQLVAISPEKPESVQDTTSKNYVTFEVLTDEGNHIARAYDLLWTVPEDAREKFSTWLKGETGKTLAEFNGIDNYELPIPATFVIAQDGTIVYMFKDEDYKQRAKNEDILKALEHITEH